MNIADYGFQTPKSEIVTTPQEAVQAADRMGYPVVLKIVSPDILHKTDAGGVALHLQDQDQVLSAYEKILSAVEKAHPGAAIQGMEVQELVSGGIEVIIGLLDDPQFGLAVLFGLGGVFTEVLRDISFRLLPLSPRDAAEMVQEIKGAAVLRGYRGQAGVRTETLVNLLMKTSQMGMDLAGKIESLDLNPVAVWEDQHRVLDTRILWHKQEKPPISAPQPDPTGLEGFFKASSVALIGASATPGKVGNAVLDSLLNHEYKGKVYPINRDRPEILGAKTYPNLKSIPEPVELAVVTVDLSYVPDLIEEAAQSGTRDMVVISGGGKELGGERAELEARIRQLSKQKSVRIIGPNCTGVFDGSSRINTFFQTFDRMARPQAGPVAMLTQSGTIGLAFLEDLAAIGMSKYASYGNRVDVDEADLLAYLADDPETGVIALYVEGFDNGRKFYETARQVARKKPVVIFKSARSSRGARASMSHTGFFGGSYDIARAAFRQAGVIAVDSYEELVACTKALATQTPAAGYRAAMISNGAGSMVQAIDLFQESGITIPELSPETVNTLKAAYPPFYLVQNPVDVTGSASSLDYEVGIEALLQDPNVDIVMPWFVFVNRPLGEDIVQKLGRLKREYSKPILAGGFGGDYSQQISKAIEAQGVPVYSTVGEWAAAALALARRGEILHR